MSTNLQTTVTPPTTCPAWCELTHEQHAANLVETIPTTCTKTRCSAAPVVRFELAGSYVRYLCGHHAALDVAALARPGRRFIIDGLPEVEVER